MDHRSAVCFAIGHATSSEPGMGCADLQRFRSPAQSDQSVLHAAAAGYFAPARQGPGGVRIVTTVSASSCCFFPMLAVCTTFALYSSHEVAPQRLLNPLWTRLHPNSLRQGFGTCWLLGSLKHDRIDRRRKDTSR